ncbi:zinc metalloprotease [Jiulongibacter sp. NS-SX5]|uniref:zinc metalloprotease n=1 Tax=Jiulongibacter sp. NS-SX5 TaxID=3463854 RepID=UPI0040598B69
MKRLIISSLILFSSHWVSAQRCAIGRVASESQKRKHESLQQLLDRGQSSPLKNLKVQDNIIRIPVVVHVIHNNSTGEIGGENNGNISDEQIFSQIEVLNQDFRREFGTRGYNEHPDGADLEIEFFLAQTGPDGTPSSGINRVFTSRRSFDVFSDLEGISALSYWPSDKYLNVWVVNLAGVYLGYGEFPGGALDGLEPVDAVDIIDGVFIDHEVFGSRTGTASTGIYSYGRTLTHEIGHWLGLIHTWGDERCGTDYCEDTPQIQDPNETFSCDPIFSRCNGVSRQNMIENYMDYTPDSCMNIFTEDQKARVRQVLELSPRRRRLVLNSQFLLPVTNTTEFNVLSNPGTKGDLKFQVLLPQFQDFTILAYNTLGQKVAERAYLDYPSTVISAEDLNLPAGPLIIIMQTAGESFLKRVYLYE